MSPNCADGGLHKQVVCLPMCMYARHVQQAWYKAHYTLCCSDPQGQGIESIKTYNNHVDITHHTMVGIHKIPRTVPPFDDSLPLPGKTDFDEEDCTTDQAW